MRIDAPIMTAQLRLATLEPEHARGPYLTWMNDPEITRFLEARFQKYGETSLRDYIQAANERDSLLLLGIFLLDSDRHIGNIKMGPVSREHRRADVGLLIGEKDNWGRGYACEAIMGIAKFAFDRLGLHKLTAGCYHTNQAALKTFLKAGFEQEGVRRQHYFWEGQWVDLVLLGRLRHGGVPSG